MRITTREAAIEYFRVTTAVYGSAKNTSEVYGLGCVHAAVVIGRVMIETLQKRKYMKVTPK